MDPENEAVIQRAISALTKGKTLIVIAHRLGTVADADNIVVVNGGQIEAQGRQAELLEHCPLYARDVEHIPGNPGQSLKGGRCIFGILKKIYAFAGGRRPLLDKSMLVAFWARCSPPFSSGRCC